MISHPGVDCTVSSGVYTPRIMCVERSDQGRRETVSFLFFGAPVLLCVLTFFLFAWDVSSAGLQGPLKGRVAPGLVYLTLTTSYSILVLRLCLSATCRFPFKLGSNYPIVPFLLAGVGIVYSPWCQFYSSQLLWVSSNACCLSLYICMLDG